jgi:hypothetical protein
LNPPISGKCRHLLATAGLLLGQSLWGASQAETLSGTVLWQSVVTELVQQGPAPARIHFKPAEGRQYVLVSAELQPPDHVAEGVGTSIPGDQVRLLAGSDSYQMIGTFEDSGYVLWFVPTYSVIPGGKTRVKAIFETPAGRELDQMEVGPDLRMPLTAPRRWSGISARLEVQITDVRTEASPVAIDGGSTPSATLEPWSGGRLISVEFTLRQKEQESDAALALTTEDFYLQGTGRIYRCAGRLTAEPERLEVGPLAVFVPHTAEPGSTMQKVRLVFCVDLRESKLWLSIGDLTVPFDVARPT